MALVNQKLILNHGGLTNNMAIRIRTINGIQVALCAAETDAKEGDLYLDDSQHYALAAKFAKDWQNHKSIDWNYPTEWMIMETQKVRDAETVLKEWIEEGKKI